MDLTLSDGEAGLLLEQLNSHLVFLERELVRTDAYRMQHEVAADLRMLTRIRDRLASLRERNAALRP